tara:strand:+ start:25 stop:480 length:456 start_codon:yes stop_codon:yes gene_type:complete
MLKLNKMTDYALVCLGVLSQKSKIFMSAQDISNESGLPLTTVQKILKKLIATSDIIMGIRGANGGYKIKKSVDKISIVNVIEALDGPIKITSCVEGAKETCKSRSLCLLEGNWNKINKLIVQTLNNFSVEDLIYGENVFITSKKNKIKKNY